MHEELLNATFGGGRFRVDKHLQGKGMRQLFAGRDTAADGMLFISYDKLPKHTTIAQFAHTTGAYAPGVLAPGVLDFAFAGSPDDKNLWDLWGVIERVPIDDVGTATLSSVLAVALDPPWSSGATRRTSGVEFSETSWSDRFPSAPSCNT